MYDINFYKIKRVCLLLVFILSVLLNAHSQTAKKIDSLKFEIEKRSGIARYDPMINLIRLQAKTNQIEKALELAISANQLALEQGDSFRIVNSLRIIGQLHTRNDKPSEAQEILQKALSIAKRHKMRTEFSTILNSLAIAYTIQAKYDKALEIHFQALKMREEDNDHEEISRSLNNIGLVYFKLKNYEKALEFYERALRLKKEGRDSNFLDHLLVNIGLCYNQQKNFSKAHEYFSLAFKECANNCSDQLKLDGQFGLGVSYFGLKNFQEALIHFNESYALAKKLDDRRFQAENLIYIARIYVREENSKEASDALMLCEEISSQSGYNEILIDTYREYSTLYRQLQDHEKSSLYQSKYISLKDSIYSAALIERIAKIQTNYAERENIAIIASKEETIQKQRSLALAIVIIAVLACLLIFVLYRSNRTKKRVNQALSDAKAIIEEQNRKLLSSNFSLNRELKEKNVELQKVNESLLRVNEELDNFIYKTSHDIRGPLASLKGMCNVALMDVKDHLALGYLKKLDITAEKLNTILTRLLIVNQINNSALGHEKIDFEGIVNDVLVLEKKKGLPPRLLIRKYIGDGIEFYSDKEFVRIILENLIDNAIKFYNDSERIDPFVDISISEEDDYVTIRVVDNGIGISQVHPDKIFQMFSRASERSETGGIGLYITKTATEKLGGTVNLKTTPEGYTEFSVTLPLSSSRVLA